MCHYTLRGVFKGDQQIFKPRITKLMPESHNFKLISKEPLVENKLKNNKKNAKLYTEMLDNLYEPGYRKMEQDLNTSTDLYELTLDELNSMFNDIGYLNEDLVDPDLHTFVQYYVAKEPNHPEYMISLVVSIFKDNRQLDVEIQKYKESSKPMSRDGLEVRAIINFAEYKDTEKFITALGIKFNNTYKINIHNEVINNDS